MIKLKNIDQKWILNFKKPFIISGPCSAENEKQILETSKRTNKHFTQVFRAGIWKPRTKPGLFEGVGEIGLKWLQNVKKNTGMLIATEVANSNHVKLSIKYDVDILWIGARTTVNPFSVQEIAESLKNTDKIILIKNPVNTDLELWIGALERLINQGIKKIGVIHRGFSTYKKIEYRNNPCWDMVLNFKKKYPNIPIICDPSHISGERNKIKKIIDIASNFEYNGFMIETHCSPNEALSDSKQQITPEYLSDIFENIELNKKKYKNNINSNKELYKLRAQIDEIDYNIFSFLRERFKLSEKIGLFKKNNNIPILQNERWENITKKLKILGENLGISEKFINNFLKLVHKESIDIQN